MRIITLLSLLLLTSTAFAQLTKEDLRTILKEEITASEKRTKEYIDLKIETVNARIDATNTRIDELDKRMSDMWRLMMGLFGLVAATIAIPQIIIAFRNKDQKEMQSQINQLREQIESMQQ